MKIKNKGKIHPAQATDVRAVLNLLPSAIIAIASVLSLEDREVLAYMMTRSINTEPNSLSPKQRSGRRLPGRGRAGGGHAGPFFDCDCFCCYTSYWCRWDSSPDRELIHEAIEAFEEDLSHGERKQRIAGKRRKSSSPGTYEGSGSPRSEREGTPDDVEKLASSREAGGDVVSSPDSNGDVASSRGVESKGFASKVFPDMMGLFNSRLWSLWGPAV